MDRVELTKLVDGRQMGEIDRRTIEEYGISGVELMQRAGREVVEAIAERWDGLESLRAVVVCGKGNNGGDGYVVAHLMRQSGATIRLFLAADRNEVGGAAAHHLQVYEEGGGVLETLVSPADAHIFTTAINEADLVVDAILGTGLRGVPRLLQERAIECVNCCGKPVVAVDMPSGVQADTGRVQGACVQAVLTVTFGLAKVGQMFYPGRSFCGALHIVDIGFAPEVVQESSSVAHLLGHEAMAALLPHRLGDAHKGSCGFVAVVAGSLGMTGAAALAADAALRAGAGRVCLGVPESLSDILEVKLTEVMTRSLAEVKRRRCLALRGLGQVEDMLVGADCLALGPGLGRYRETAELVWRLVRRTVLPLVLDADGLNACAGGVDIFKGRSAATILTPHVGEFALLSGLKKSEILANPLGTSRAFAEEYKVVLVLKGAPTVIALSDGRMVVNPTGNAGMATAGSGDVLTGLIAGFIAQGLNADRAACLGVFVHGAAGDRARDRLGEWAMKAGDIAAEVPGAMLKLASYRRSLT